MNYTANGKTYTADDGYVFQHKEKGGIYKKLRLTKNDIIDNYEVIIEPEKEETDDSDSTDL